MKISSMLLLLLSILSILAHPSRSTTILVDGVSEWKDPSVCIGDSIIFQHQYHYNLYIFQNQRAFILCNFTQATLLTKPNSTSYTWHPSRPGFFYFTFNNGSLKFCNHDSKKLSIKVSPAAAAAPPAQLPPTASPPVTAPIPGDIVSSSPAYPWPFRPRDETASSPAPAPGSSAASSPMATMPTLRPDKGGGSGIPFINSNPAVPLPTGEIDSATIRPLPTSGHHQLFHPKTQNIKRVVYFVGLVLTGLFDCGGVPFDFGWKCREQRVSLGFACLCFVWFCCCCKREERQGNSLQFV